ncbi:MAG TPA: alpha/beta hydrolase [Phenylobacterium sp.]|jgi:pimeloyl-ACP methyl ester carboxylesterase|nr:alpha/beta hydrolase [Phenylobacterium sp.]
MSGIWKTEAGGESVRARYAQFLQFWPAANEQLRLATGQGETFVVACGPTDAPPVLLLHGALANSSSWMGDVAAWSQHFRLYAIDMIGEPGFSAPSRPPLDSEAYAIWLDEVLTGLGVKSAALVGISLGGWLALDYATRRPERVSALALLCPGGVGKRRNFLLWAAPLMLLGPWGQRMALKKLGGLALTEGASPAAKAFGDFMRLIQASTRPRRDSLPRFSDEALSQLKQPLLAILGGKDAILDSAGTRARLTQNVSQADIRWRPDEGHFLFGQGPVIEAFLRQALAP